jgi:hypothetical protein
MFLRADVLSKSRKSGHRLGVKCKHKFMIISKLKRLTTPTALEYTLQKSKRSKNQSLLTADGYHPVPLK